MRGPVAHAIQSNVYRPSRACFRKRLRGPGKTDVVQPHRDGHRLPTDCRSRFREKPAVPARIRPCCATPIVRLLPVAPG